MVTYREVMRTPPHLFLVNNPSHVDSRTSTCHGHSPNVAPFPPTIRPLFCMRGLTPHSRVQQILDMNRQNSLQNPLLLYRIEVKCKHMQTELHCCLNNFMVWYLVTSDSLHSSFSLYVIYIGHCISVFLLKSVIFIH